MILSTGRTASGWASLSHCFRSWSSYPTQLFCLGRSEKAEALKKRRAFDGTASLEESRHHHLPAGLRLHAPAHPAGRPHRRSAADALLNTARDAGVNYFDTAYPYHGGESEPFVGRVIAKWPRESFYLATKLPLWQCDSLEKAQQIYHSQFERLGVDTIDFYLLHSLHRARYDKAKRWASWTGSGRRRRPGASGTSASPATTTRTGWNTSCGTSPGILPAAIQLP